MPNPRDSLVVFLHGVGAAGADLAPLAEPLRRQLRSTPFAAPDAPEPFDGGGPGRQWFSVAGVTPANRAQRVEQARRGFDRILAEAIAAFGFADRLDRVALFGFSQGAIMALDAVACGRWPVAAVVAAAGRLAGPGEPSPSAAATPILLLHGEADAMIPADESRRAAARLTAAGFAVETHVYPGLGHSLSAESVATAGAFLARAFAPG